MAEFNGRARRALALPLFVILVFSACAAVATVPERPIFSQVGVASWYGPDFQGQTTANGERFNMQAMTAAHRSLPFGTIVRVTDLDSGRVVKVRINDRGPLVAGRVLDLSKNAARRLGIADDGTAEVRLQVFASDQTAGSAGVSEQ